MRQTIGAIAALATAAGVAASPAIAEGANTLKLTAESGAVVGKPMIVRASGTIPPPGDIAIPYWFSLSAIPPTVTGTCPPDRWEGVQFALGSGGSVLVLSQREVPDAAGNFTVPVAVTPSKAGSVLLCGYTDDGLTNTLARASLRLDIASAGSRRHSRGALKRASARCRRLQPRRARTRCLRAVRRVARRGS
jgi:hypothetical protein